MVTFVTFSFEIMNESCNHKKAGSEYDVLSKCRGRKRSWEVKSTRWRSDFPFSFNPRGTSLCQGPVQSQDLSQARRVIEKLLKVKGMSYALR